MNLHKFAEKPDAFIVDKKRRRQTLETSQSHPYAKVMFEEPNDEGNYQVCKIIKAAAHALKNGGTLKDHSADTKKSKRGAGATLGNKGKNQYGGSRG